MDPAVSNIGKADRSEDDGKVGDAARAAAATAACGAAGHGVYLSGYAGKYVNARKRASRSANADGEENINEYILVTIIAACDGGLKLPAVTDSTELRTALKRIGAIRVDALQAVEVLWTPQEEGDTLSEDELLRDYPQLNVL